MTQEVHINGRRIGTGEPTYVIAEMSCNHHGNFNRAIEIIHAMKKAGADAVKLQTYTADTHTIDSEKSEFHIGKGTLWEGKTLHALYREAFTPWNWQPKLKKLANELGMDLLSAPSDMASVDFLEEMDIPAYKIASFELVDLELIARVARTGKPVIISTGMARLEEIEEAVATVRSEDNDQIILLKCTSAYPTPPEEANLRTITDLRERFCVPVGLSDHTLGIAVPVAAVALGACVVEKHFCMSRKEPGPDSPFSLEPKEFKEMIDAIRITEKALGKVFYGQTVHEQATAVFRRSLFAVEDIASGETLTEKNVRSIRPGYGLPPKEMKNILGKKAKVAIERGTPLSHDLLA